MSKRGLEYIQSAQKRNLDVVAGSAITACLAPLGIAVGAVTAYDTQSLNPLFLQERSGGIRDRITTFKFKTISSKLGELSSVKTFGTFDPRASKLGQAIRQTGLDEIPQILNVLRGEMTLVGPRPLLDLDVERLEAIDKPLFHDWHEIYKASKPGITGPSQLFRHHYRYTSDEMFAASMRMDIDYAEHASLGADLRWLARTPLGMLQANLGVEDTAQLGSPATTEVIAA